MLLAGGGSSVEIFPTATPEIVFLKEQMATATPVVNSKANLPIWWWIVVILLVIAVVCGVVRMFRKAKVV